MSDVIKEKLGEGIELLIEGLPQAVITPQVQAKAVMSLVQYAIPVAGSISAGVIGGVSNAALKIGSQVYRLKFTFIAMRAITALEIYSEAIDWIEYQKSRGVWDEQLSDDTVDYLREDLRRRHKKWRK
jgi:hypothetical protein